MKTAIVDSKELGTNCWSPAKLTEGKRCSRVMLCKYPDKRTCKAVDAEIAYLNAGLVAAQQHVEGQLAELVKAKER